MTTIFSKLLPGNYLFQTDGRTDKAAIICPQRYLRLSWGDITP